MPEHHITDRCNCVECPKHKNHDFTYTCDENCPDHGPFPTPWVAQGFLAYPDNRPAVCFQRYSGPHTVEKKYVKIEVPV